jgi:hypothetical protein
MHGYMILPDGPAALGHPANEDLFGGTPVRAATSWRVYRSGWIRFVGPPVGRDRSSFIAIGRLFYGVS